MSRGLIEETGQDFRSVLISRRGFVAGSLGTAGAMLLASCSSGGSGAGGKADLAISWWGADDRHKKTQALLKLYSQKHPDVTFEPTFGGFLGYQDKMVTEMSGGHGPDVMQIADRLPFIASGSLLDLDAAIASKKIDLSDADSKTVGIQKFKGKQYTLPWGLAAGVMFYDTKVFDDAKIPAPQFAWTWDNYRDTAKSITEATPDGYYGSADIWAPAGTGSWAPFQSYLLSRKTQVYTEDGHLNFTPDMLTEWFSFWDAMRKSGYVTPPTVTAQESGFETSPIVKGKAAIYPINSSIASSLQGLAKNPLGITTLPTGFHSTQYLTADQFGQYVNASITIGANAKTKFPDQVIDFINFAFNDPEANKITLMSRGVPLSSKMATLVTPLVSAVEKDMIAVIAYIQKHAVPSVVTAPTADGQLSTLMNNSHQAIAFQKASIADTVTAFFVQSKRLLAQ